MSDRGKLFVLLMGGLFRVIAILLIIAAIASLVVTFYYNHWMGWGRLLYIVISIVCYILIYGFMNEFYYWIDGNPSSNWALIWAASILALHFGLAGLNCRPWATTAYAVEHGKLAVMKPGVWWTNPFKLTCLLTYDPVQKVKCRTALASDQVISVDIPTRYRPGVTIWKMNNDGFLPVMQGGSPERTEGVGGDTIEKCVDLAIQKAIAIVGLTIADFKGELAKNKRQAYLDAIEAEVTRTLPAELELEKGAKVSARFQFPDKNKE